MVTTLSRFNSTAPMAVGMADAGRDIVYAVGVVGLILIGLFLLGAIPMIPDLIRYIKIRSM